MRKHLVDGLATTAVALTLVAALAVSPGWVAAADEGSGDAHPSRSDVRAAREAADGKAAEVASVQARLASAQGRLRDTAVRVAQAEEAFNRARWNYREARREQRAAERIHETTETQLGGMRDEYVDVVVSSYEMSPSLTAMAAILESDGIASVVDRTASLQNAQAAMDQVYDDYDAAALLAGVSSDQATEARLAADALREETKQARATARETQRAAAGEADSVAAERVDLIGELARLQGISVALAEERQEWLEAQATPTATPTPTPTPTPSAEPTPTQEPTQEPTQARRRADEGSDDRADRGSHSEPRHRAHTAAPTPTPTPTPTPDAHAHGGPHADGDADHPTARPGRWRGGRDRLRPGPDRRPLPVGRRRARQVGLLGPDHARVAGGRRLAAALLSGSVRRRPRRSPRATCSPVTSCSGARRAARPRSTTSRCTPAAG